MLIMMILKHKNPSSKNYQLYGRFFSRPGMAYWNNIQFIDSEQNTSTCTQKFVLKAHSLEYPYLNTTTDSHLQQNNALRTIPNLPAMCDNIQRMCTMRDSYRALCQLSILICSASLQSSQKHDLLAQLSASILQC